jgi:hypothetical protein
MVEMVRVVVELLFLGVKVDASMGDLTRLLGAQDWSWGPTEDKLAQMERLRRPSFPIVAESTYYST